MLHIKETEKPRKEEGKTRVLMAAANWKGEWGWQGQERAGDGKHSRHSLCPVKTCTEACWLTQRPSVAFAITKEGDPRCTPSSAIEPFSLPFYIISHFLLLVIFHLSHLFISLLLSWKWDCWRNLQLMCHWRNLKKGWNYSLAKNTENENGVYSQQWLAWHGLWFCGVFSSNWV